MHSLNVVAGDGVNDVAAMKAADVAVALLNGFGKEIEDMDLDDERRKKRAQAQPLGTNRLRARTSLQQLDRNAARVRVNKQIEDAHEAIRQRMKERNGKNSNTKDLDYTLEDAKEMLSATLNAMSAERRRNRLLKLGGGDAARILAEERRNSTLAANDRPDDTTTVKPGEASLVASFSCLHPSIDGVDSVLRAGVATAACALATQEMIALHSLLSCYHLATLYRDGFRYGKNMWQVEMFLYMLLDNARYTASCTPRPRLPSSVLTRPPNSLFHPASFLSQAGQTIVHLVCMTFGVRYARKLAQPTTSGKSARHLPRFRLQPRQSQPRILAKLLGAIDSHLTSLSLASSDTATSSKATSSNYAGGLLGRRPFQPSYETNMVFLLSIVQSAVSCLVNHSGAPFCRSILESRSLSVATMVTIGCVIVGIFSDMIPIITVSLLELKPMPTKQSQWIVFLLILSNVVGCIACRFVAENWFLPEVVAGNYTKKSQRSTGIRDKLRTKAILSPLSLSTAADLEEQLLEEETALNLRGGVITFCALVYFAMLDYFFIPSKARSNE